MLFLNQIIKAFGYNKYEYIKCTIKKEIDQDIIFTNFGSF